jgi:2-keto-4-pentenoate hydratase
VTGRAAAHAAIAERLWRAEQDGGLVAAPTRDVPDLSERDAYAIQRVVIERRLAAGERPAGWKVGMSSAIGRDGSTPGPIYGRLLQSMLVAPGEPIATAELNAPEVEGEIAFVLDRPLRGPGVTTADVLAAARGVLPAIEVIAGRLAPGEHAVADFVADNAFSARAVVGETLVPLDGLDLRLVGMVHSRGGAVVGAGAGARVLGHPAASVAWLANALAGGGGELEAGAVVLSGSLAPPVPARRGDVFTVEIDRLGSVSAVFA